MPNLQQAKVDTLFATGDFDAVFVDDIYQENRAGKADLFKEIAENAGLAPEQIWIVGDNPEAEVKAGNSLEMNMVHIARPGVEPSE